LFINKCERMTTAMAYQKHALNGYECVTYIPRIYVASMCFIKVN